MLGLSDDLISSAKARALCATGRSQQIALGTNSSGVFGTNSARPAELSDDSTGCRCSFNRSYTMKAAVLLASFLVRSTPVHTTTTWLSIHVYSYYQSYYPSPGQWRTKPYLVSRLRTNGRTSDDLRMGLGLGVRTFRFKNI